MLLVVVNILFILIISALYIKQYKALKSKHDIDLDLTVLTNKVNSIRYGNLSTKITKFKGKKFEKLSESINRLAETLSDREKMIIEYQAELTKQNKFQEAVINTLSDGILIVDEQKNIIIITPKVANWFQCDEKDIIGKNIYEFIQGEENKFDDEEVFVKNSNDAFQATLKPLDIEEKRDVIILKNITMQKEIEQLKDDFVATLTHDLKVPILAEANIIEFLLNEKFGKITDKQSEVLLNMKHSNSELLELVQILLETYKVDKSGIELNRENVNIKDFILDVIKEMSSILTKAEMNINVNIKEDMIFNIDKIHFKRVIKNLIQNSISYSGTNKNIDIDAILENNKKIIKITDYGRGIAKEDIEHIFKKYYSTAKKFRKIGTGLGLYLSSQIVKAHGGEITVKSEENIRTEFCITLPD